MNEYISIPTIGVLGLLSTLLTSQDSLFMTSPKFRLTKTGWYVVIIGIIIIVISVWQILVTNKEKEKQEIARIYEERTRDSIVTIKVNIGVEESRKKLFNDLSIALKKQNLQIDTVSQSLTALRDSAKTIVVKYPRQYPILTIYNGQITHSIKNDSVNIIIGLTSDEASANILFIDQICKVNFYDGSYDVTKKIRLYQGPLTIAKENTLNKEFLIVPRKPIKNIELFYYGKFSDLDSSKILTYDMVYEYNLETKKAGFKSQHDRDSLKQLGNIKW